ncbi:hypothetical protein HMPREF0673_02141 [Leyella stercorea DSM 18206]|uniref:DUF1573 domain-containing protein n=1 Tax=Leyella stercorea DSM 18206 TaxID=1002367 RepID=G6AZS4_9BACT|nr:DUF1573 domain-containing protein [Leyella stercorea]EHJ38205.1 hypothetical protein HMPREF0673_02141 [Leyella stercorea DSM 18206]
MGINIRHIKAVRRTALRSAFGILLFVALGLVGSSTLTSCHKRLALTIVEVEDSVRHYPSVVLGDELTMVYVLRNTGDEMLVITDIQPACPTIESAAENVTTIPPGEEVPMKFVYHADKNIGLARHSIRLYGNIAPKGVAELVFDTHVVRPSIDLSDHEEYHQKELRSVGEHLLDGRYSEKGYYTDDHPSREEE